MKIPPDHGARETMIPNSLTTRVAVWLLAAGAAAVAWAQQETKPPVTSPEQKREVGRMLGEFTAARRDPDRRAEIVGEAIQRGAPFVTALYEVIGREMHPQLQRYSNNFFQQAAKLAGKQIAEADLQEVIQLRQKVLALRNLANLTKEMIVAEGEPALNRLEEIFVVDRRKVLAASPSLQSDRDRLGELGKLWERCAQYLYEQVPDNEEKPREPPSFEKYLAGEESMAAGLAGPMDPRTKQILATNNRMASQLEPEEVRAVLALNLTRNLLGLPAVVIDLRLCAAARDHSKDMQTLKFFAHESPVPGKTTPWDRAKRFGTTASGENIAMGYHDGQAVNMGWFRSPGHHKNMLAEHTRVGLGQSGTYYTQKFGR
jgi:uncharacterized protein YkwD